MDKANGSFTACFLGIGNKGEEIGKALHIEFKAPVKCYQAHQNDEQFTKDEEIPQLIVLSLNDNPDEAIKLLPQQDVMFLFGSQDDELFWEIRDMIINLKKADVLFSLVLSSTEASHVHIYDDQEELLIYLDHGSEKQAVTFVKDMCRHSMFPRLVSIVYWVWEIVPNNNVKIITYESHSDDIELFKQFLADHGEVIKNATGLFCLISSNLPSFSVRHINEIFSAIENAINVNCNWCGCDSLYGDEGTDYAIKVTIICGERKVENASAGY
jgi:hypothetical protein